MKNRKSANDYLNEQAFVSRTEDERTYFYVGVLQKTVDKKMFLSGAYKVIGYEARGLGTAFDIRYHGSLHIREGDIIAVHGNVFIEKSSF